MADFCKQCAVEAFGDDVSSDFEGILSEQEADMGYIIEVLCEGCGPTEVDEKGTCVWSKCPLHGAKDGHG